MEVDSGGINVKFTWDEELSELHAGTNWGPSTRAHCSAIKLLRQAMLKSPKWEGRLAGKVDAMIREHLGDLKHLIKEHGSLADALASAVELEGSLVEAVTDLKAEMDRFWEELKDFAMEADISKEYILNIITRIREHAKRETLRCAELVDNLYETVHLLLQSPPGSSTTLASPIQPLIPGKLLHGLDGDTCFGFVNMGGNVVALTMNYLFSVVQDLQSKVDVLTERPKNTRVYLKPFPPSHSSGSGLSPRTPPGEV